MSEHAALMWFGRFLLVCVLMIAGSLARAEWYRLREQVRRIEERLEAMSGNGKPG